MTGPAPDAPNARAIAPSQPSARQLVILQEIKLRLDELARLAEPIAAPGLQLTLADCNELENTTGLGSTRSPSEFIKAVERLASIRIGDIRIGFTPGQLHELQHRATKRGHTVEQEMKAVVARIEDELFYKGA